VEVEFTDFGGMSSRIVEYIYLMLPVLAAIFGVYLWIKSW